MEAIKDLLESNEIQAVNVDGKERTIQSRIILHELCQRDGSKEWTRNGKQSRALMIAGDILLVRLPVKEGGQYQWLKMSVKDYASNLGNFYKGDGIPGPAKKFAMSKQSEEVAYTLFNKSWNVTDIGTFEVASDKDHKALKHGDRVYFVTSKGENNWLLYLDARHGEARGTGGVFIGVQINPEADIASVL